MRSAAMLAKPPCAGSRAATTQTVPLTEHSSALNSAPIGSVSNEAVGGGVARADEFAMTLFLRRSNGRGALGEVGL
jgi:hypothetical protein